MDTPTIAAYYREADPMKRKKLLEESIAAGEEPEENAIRKEIWKIRYQDAAEQGAGSRADGFLALWMIMEFNRDAGNKFFGGKGARKELKKTLDKLQFQEVQAKSDLHKELMYRECVHLVNLYLELCKSDRSYNTILCGLMKISEESARTKIQKDIYETAIQLPASINMEAELGLITRAAKEVYALHFPEEGNLE